MNPKQLRYVLLLAQEGSFSRAAELLNISQPSLSQYIKKIEKQLGLELFDRANGEVRLTDAGRAYIETGRKILELEHQLDVQLEDLSDHKTGSLIVGAAPYRAAGMLPEIAMRFRQIHPGMHLVVREGTTAELAEGMQHGEYDLCLTMLPLDKKLFTYEKVAEEELILAVPAGEKQFETVQVPERKYPAVDAEQLRGQRFVKLTDTQHMQKQLEDFEAEYALSLRTAAVVKSLSAQIAMVRAGVGMALMPSGIERFCAEGEVCLYSIRQPLPKRELILMWRKDRKLSLVAQELKDVICSIAW